MAYKISDACVNCGACEGECPVGAISEANGARVIDADACISCGACAGVCPTEAISEDAQVSLRQSGTGICKTVRYAQTAAYICAERLIPRGIY